MKRIIIPTRPGFDEWRTQARACLQAGLPPGYIFWQAHDAAQECDLFNAAPAPQNPAKAEIPIPRAFIEQAELASRNSAPDRFALLYRILWRLVHENKNLLHHKTDDDIIKMNRYIKAVARDAYKIKAFLRFREAKDDNGPCYIAWYEPEHYALELVLPFFQTRFKNMRWSILTPYIAAHWNCTRLTLSDNPDPGMVPKDDQIEQYWLKYYASTFNPARPKKAAMLNQMPKKYWKNMPETVLIPGLLRESESRARTMIENGAAPPPTKTDPP